MLSTAPAVAVQPADAESEDQILLDSLKAPEDPTILTNRFWVEAEYNDDRNDNDSFELLFGVRKAWHVSDNQDWGLQIEMPYRRTSTGGPDNNVVNQGLGDIKVTTGTAFRLSDTVRIGGGLELRMPTGERELSANIWRLQEFVAVAWDATPWLTFTPKLRYFHTLDRQEGASPQRYLELYVPATFILPGRWSLTPRYEMKMDFISDDTVHSGKFTVGRQLASPPLNLSLSFKVPFESTSNQYQLVFAVTSTF